MLLGNSYSHDARVSREASALVEDGHAVTVIARPIKDAPQSATLNGIRVVRAPRIRGFGIRTKLRTATHGLTRSDEYAPSTTASRLRLPAWSIGAVVGTLRAIHTILNITFGWVRAALQTRAYASLCVDERPDVIHAHDLNTLRAGVIAKKRSGALLVYDAHELEANRVQRNPIENRLARWSERVWIRSADRVITVSPSIGEVLARRYRVVPTIILNVPVPRKGPNRDFRAALGVDSEVSIVLYQGGIMRRRGLEQVGEAVRLLKNCVFVMMGPDYGFGAFLENHFREVGVSDRVRQLPPVPSTELLGWTAAASVGLCTIMDASLSYRLALPNKLFEYMAAGIPVVASDLPELRRVVIGEQIGELCDPTDPSSIAAAINRILDDPEKAADYRANAQVAARKYNWDVEKRKLVDLYRGLEQLVPTEHA